jgi:branched-chain amino acid aminotransferase
MSSGFRPTEWVWHDGEMVPWNDANLHVMSHVVHYGSSIFEGVRCYDGVHGPAIFRLGDHMRRFADSCRIYRMPLKHGRDTLVEACRSVIRANGLSSGYIRPIAYRGFGAVGVNPAASPVHTWILCWPWGAYLGDDAAELGIDVCVSTWRRAAPDTFPMLAKAGGNYLSAQLMKMEAIENGFAEAIALSTTGLVSEGSGENLFVVLDGKLITPANDGSLLPGLTRDSITTIARDMGITVREEPMPREMLYTADELFLTGTAAEITAVRSVDRIPVGNGRVGPITRALHERFHAIVRGQAPDTYGWLTPVAEPLRAAYA